MGAKVSTLVFRPPKVTKMSEDNFFFIDVDVASPLAVPDVEGGPCGCNGSINTPDADLASLDSSFLGSDTSSAYSQKKSVRNGVQYKIPAFFIRRRNATQTILFSHGNAEDLGMMFERMRELAKKLSVNIMAYDYTGYGMSLPMGEKPSENMSYRNIEAAFEYLTQTRKIPPSSILLYGRSLGGGPSCYLAAKTAMQGQSVGGLILHSAFLSVYKVVTDIHGLDMRLVGDMFHNEKRAKNIRCPTIIIHGKRDVVVPFWHGPRLLSAIHAEYRWKPMFVEDIGHNSIESKRRDLYLDALTSFISGVRIMKEMNAPIHRDFRASEEDVNDTTNFYVNTMWLKHAKLALTDAFVGKSRPSSSKKSSASISAYSVSAHSANDFSNNRTRSFSCGYGGSQNNLSDARDEEDEFAPWREEARQHSERPTSPIEPENQSTSQLVTFETTPTRRTPTRQKSESARHSKTPIRMESTTPTRRLPTPTRKQKTPTRRTPLRSQSVDKSEYVSKQQKQKQQYRKTNSMQLQAKSRGSRGRESKDRSMYEM